MKKIMISVAFALSVLASCTPQYDEMFYDEIEPQQVEEKAEIYPFLAHCLSDAYDTHVCLSEDGLCEECECCWEFVPSDLRKKYEKGDELSVAEMESVISFLETSPSFLDTLAEYDSFVDLDYYKEFGIEWFDPNYGYSEDDLMPVE